MKDGRELVREAVEDAKSLRNSALEAAKKEIIENMAPAIKLLLEKNINGVLGRRNEGQNRMRRVAQDYPGESKTGFEEAKDPDAQGETKMDDMSAPKKSKELDMEALAAFFPNMSEEPDEGLDGMPTLGEEPGLGLEAGGLGALGGEDDEMPLPKKEGKKKGGDEEEEEGKEPVEEEIEISESELRKVYEAALQTEVEVKKGFSDMTPMGELDDVQKDLDKGLADIKTKSATPWEEGEVSAKQDYTVKEMIQRGLRENKALKAALTKSVALSERLAKQLHEVNLFNSKVLHVNKILNKHGKLTMEQKGVVLESIDKARSVSEVKMVAEAILNSFASVGQLSESKSRKPAVNAQRVRSSGAPDHKVLSESVDRSQTNESFARMQKLAGLLK